MKKNNFRKIITLLLVLALIAGAAITADAAETTISRVSLTASQSTQSSISLSWEKISGASGYEVVRATTKDGTYSRIKTITSGGTLSYKNTGLTLGETYYYKVRAYRTVGGKKIYGKYSYIKSVRLTYAKPKYSVYLPSAMNQKDGTVVISLTNNAKSDNLYFDGVFALEVTDGSNSRVYNAASISFEKPAQGIKGTLALGKRLILRPGEKVRFTCKVDGNINYVKSKTLLTTCIRYKSKDFVGVYSLNTGNKIYTTEEYWDEIN